MFVHDPLEFSEVLSIYDNFNIFVLFLEVEPRIYFKCKSIFINTFLLYVCYYYYLKELYSAILTAGDRKVVDSCYSLFRCRQNDTLFSIY